MLDHILYIVIKLLIRSSQIKPGPRYPLPILLARLFFDGSIKLLPVLLVDQTLQLLPNPCIAEEGAELVGAQIFDVPRIHEHLTNQLRRPELR